MSLQQWQVPVIIGLLPVLMHIALGVFFAGLIVYLYSLNTVMSGVVTGIASTAFITYFLTNLLPLYKPGCPYKTPLTIHSYAFLVAVWDRVRTLTNARESTPSKEHLSLKSVEQERVTCDADAIDAQSLAWLHDVSSNSSVQRIVLQAISNLPLGPSVDTVRQTIPDVEFSILRCLRQYGTAERRYGYERLTRAFIRFESVPNSRPYPFQEDSVDNSLLVLFNTDDTHHAINFLVQQIVKPTVKLDAISWLRVFRNALADRGDWLEVHDDESVVWPAFLEFFLKGHSCLTAVHNRKEVASTIVEYFGEFPTSINRYDNFRLTINPLDNKHPDRKTTSDGIDLQRAIQEFLYPSLCDFLLLTTFTPFITRADESLPSDIRLHLALLQCPFTHVATRPITEGMLPLRRVISFIKAYVDISPSHRQTFGGPIIHHHQLPSAVFDSIYYLLTKETTSFTGRICHRDQRDLLHALFRALVLDKGLRQKHEGWLADDTMKMRVFSVIFQPPQVILFPLITEVLEYFYLTKSLIGPEVYRRISKGRWFDSLRQEFMLSDPTDDFHALPLDERGFGATDYAFHFLVVAYIDGLEILEAMAPEVYEQTMADIRMPSNLLTLCKVLILGDIDSRNRMWKLGKLVGRDLWQTCMMSLPDFLRSDGAKELYALQSFYRGGRRPYHDHVL